MASMSAKDLYKEGRKLHNSNPSKAMQYYEAAAKKSYVKAWRQIGSRMAMVQALRHGRLEEDIQAYFGFRRH